MFKFKKKKYKKFRSILDKVKTRLITPMYFVSGKLRRRAIILKLKKGDIILAKPGFFRLSPIALMYRVLLRSDYVHSMMYIGNSRIIHTTKKEGVTIHNVPRKIFKRNRYTIYRVKSINSQQRRHIVEESLKFKHSKIDTVGLVFNIPRNIFGIKKQFIKIEKNRLWCSKLIFNAYSSAGIKLMDDSESTIITSESLSKSKLLDLVQ